MSTKLLVFFLTFLLSICFSEILNGQERSSTIAKEVDMREGPGSYFDLILRLNRGVTVSKGELESGWMNVNVDSYDGWIPDHSQLFDKDVQQAESEDNFRERMREIYSRMSGEENDSTAAYASPTQVAAVVRGFTKQYSENRRASLQYDFSENFGRKTDTENYERFKKDRLGDWDREQAQNYYEILENEAPLYNPDMEPLGWAVASLLAEEGLIEHPEIETYLQNLANLAVESSHRIEIPIQIYLLDQNKIAGYSTPNGIIFITKGALEAMESEAELLFFIAHEVAHVVFQHGIQEAENREVRVRRDEVFSELDQKLNQEDRSEEYVRVSQELSAWADQVYQYLVQDRLEEYELLADTWGLIYTYRLGYNPNAALNLLRRIRIEEGEMGSSVGKLEWKGVSLENREENILNTLQELEEYDQHPGFEYKTEFLEMIGKFD